MEDYKYLTTFKQDFRIANCFGPKANKDTYKKGIEYASSDYKYLTELELILNNFAGFYFNEGRKDYQEIYTKLCRDAEKLFFELYGKDKTAVEYFQKITD